jgi:hypothetical protein
MDLITPDLCRNGVIAEYILAYVAYDTAARSQFNRLTGESIGRTPKFQCVIADNLLDLLELMAHISGYHQVYTHVRNRHEIRQI